VAQTQLTDAILPSVFSNYLQVLTSQLSEFVQSGIIVQDPEFDSKLAGGGRTFNMPFWNDLADDAENVSSDTGSDAVPKKVTSGEQIAIRLDRNQSWRHADLAAMLAGSDPAGVVARRVAPYWTRRLQDIVIAVLKGVIADNIANDSGDMLHRIARDTAGAVGDEHLFSAEAFIQTKQTMGDAASRLSAIAMHSDVYAQAETNDLIDFLPDSEGRPVASYRGLRVIVDDGLAPVLNATTSLLEYDTVVFGAGAFARGNGVPKVPVESERHPLANVGGGAETLITRVAWLVHPKGFAFTDASVAGQSPTNAELANAANWNRVVERKLVPLAVLRSNG
jgi:hypothetical protein